jgi:hypothetical protein
MDTLADVVRRVPGYALSVGADAGENVAAVRRLLAGEAPDAL